MQREVPLLTTSSTQRSRQRPIAGLHPVLSLFLDGMKRWRWQAQLQFHHRMKEYVAVFFLLLSNALRGPGLASRVSHFSCKRPSTLFCLAVAASLEGAEAPA